MDYILETADTFLFDRIWANILPLSPAVSNFDPISTIAANFKGYDYQNASFDAASRLSGDFSARSGWQWTPASEHWSFAPGEYAWMSRWDRGNIWRQLATLYAITW